jgi:hypothetical protein
MATLSRIIGGVAKEPALAHGWIHIVSAQNTDTSQRKPSIRPTHANARTLGSHRISQVRDGMDRSSHLTRCPLPGLRRCVRTATMHATFDGEESEVSLPVRLFLQSNIGLSATHIFEKGGMALLR